MLYAFPDEWTLNTGPMHENDDFSKRDKDFIRSEQMYPGRGSPESVAQEISVANSLEAEISQAEEQDLYRFEVRQPRLHIIETTGSTDVVLSLFGPDSATNLIAENDDGGTGTNSRIAAELEPGIYYARVQHYDRVGSGEYRILVSAH